MRILIKYFSLFCIFVFTGCIDETNYPEPQVSGVVYDQHGFPIPGCNVSIINYPVSVTNNLGMFQLENVLNPYDLTVNYSPYFCLKYLGLKNFETKIYCPVNSIPGILFNLRVSFPRFHDNQALILKFIGDENPYSEMFSVYRDTASVIDIYYKLGYSNTHGKLIILLVKYDETGKFIQSYDAFSMKEITLNFNTLNSILFAADDFIYAIPSTTADFNIQLPPNVISEYSEISLHFSGMDKNSDMQLMIFWEFFEGQFRVPLLPGLSYKIKTENKYFVNSYFDFDGTKFILSEPGSDVSIIHDPLLNLSISGLYSYGVWDTTEFIADGTENDGIYLFSLGKRDHEFDPTITTVFTDKNRIKFSDFYSRGFEPEPYTARYFCYVYKITGCKTINELASSTFTTDDKFSSKKSSERIYFYVGP